MYYRNKVKQRTHWAYYWAWVISVKAAISVETVAMSLRSRQPTADEKMYSEGTPVAWFTGPPFFSQLKRLIVNLRGIRNEPIQHLF